MLCLTADPNTAQQLSGLTDVEIIYHDLQNHDFYDRITLLGLELEKILLDRSLIWSNNYCNKILFIWEKLDIDFNELSKHLIDFRGDEVLIKDTISVNWIVGNPRAIIKWAASISKLRDILPQRTIYPRTDNTRKLIWWAMRLNLKLYILPK